MGRKLVNKRLPDYSYLIESNYSLFFIRTIDNGILIENNCDSNNISVSDKPYIQV